MLFAQAEKDAVAIAQSALPPSDDETDSVLEAIPMGKVAYQFDDNFQDRIVAMMVRDTDFMRRTEGLIEPNFFEDMSNQILAATVMRYYKLYKKAPGDIRILVTLIKDDIEKKLIRQEWVAEVVFRLKGTITENPRAVYAIDISDRDFVINKVADFARHQAVSNAILECAEILETKRDFSAIENKIKKALDVGAVVGNTGYNYAAELENRTEMRKMQAAGLIVPTGITTGYPDLDKVLFHKGWGRSEMTVLLGAAKSGKTTALISFAINAIAAKYNVLYITLEVSADIIGQRMDANIANQVMMEMGSHIMDVDLKVRDFMRKAGRIEIQEFPTGSLKVSDLNRLVESYKSKGETFDIIVLDYADLMAPEKYTDNAIENSKMVYQHLRGLAMREKVALLTATQTNREGAKATVARMTDVADDFNKVRIADLVISINKTEEEKAMGEARLYFAASRNQAGDFSLRVKQDIDRMRFISAVLGKDG